MRPILIPFLAFGVLAGCPKGPVEGPSSENNPVAPAPGDPAAGASPDGAVGEGATPSGASAVVVGGTLEEQVAAAVGLLEKGSDAELDQAIRILEAAAPQDPSGVVALDLGIALQKRGLLDRARSQYEQLIAAHPDHGDAWAYLASVQELQGQDAAARETVRQGIERAPDNVPLRIALINQLRADGRVDEAIEESKKALRINAKSLGIYNAFGLCYIARKDYTLARFILQKAVQEIEGAEDNAFLQTNLGWTYFLQGNTPQATFHLKKAVEADPDLVPALVYLSKIYMEDHNYADTISLLENAARLDPANAEIQLTLGVAYRGTGRLDDAQSAYQRALQLDPANPAPHFNLGVLIGDYRKDYASAIASFQQYIAGGGPETALAEQYIRDIQKEKELSEKRAKLAEETKRREEERKRKEELARQEGARAGVQPTNPDDPSPDAPEPEGSPSEESDPATPPTEGPGPEGPAPEGVEPGTPAPESGEPETPAPAPEGSETPAPEPTDPAPVDPVPASPEPAGAAGTEPPPAPSEGPAPSSEGPAPEGPSPETPAPQ